MISSSPDAAPQGGGTTVIGEYPELADAATVSWGAATIAGCGPELSGGGTRRRCKGWTWGTIVSEGEAGGNVKLARIVVDYFYVEHNVCWCFKSVFLVLAYTGNWCCRWYLWMLHISVFGCCSQCSWVLHLIATSSIKAMKHFSTGDEILGNNSFWNIFFGDDTLQDFFSTRWNTIRRFANLRTHPIPNRLQKNHINSFVKAWSTNFCSNLAKISTRH